MQPIAGTEFDIDCDTLLLSVGLIPENELSRGLNLEMHPLTSGPIVDQRRQTSMPGIFAAGNVVHVHDLVDFVSEEAEIAGKFAALTALGKLDEELTVVNVEAGNGIRTCVPQKLSLPQEGEAARLFMRVANPERKVKLEVKSGDTLIMSKILPVAKPSEMIALDLSAEKTKLIKGSLIVALNREA